MVDEVFAGTPSDKAPEEQQGRRILLAEDGLVNQHVAIGLLRLKGHDVIVANDGNEAVAALEHQSFDVVLMDVQMPEMDGFEATRIIRERERISQEHTPVIAMTASAMKGDRERCLDAGMDDYISKPIDPDQLYKSIDHYAGKNGNKPSAGDQPRPSPNEDAMNDVVDWQVAEDRIPGGQSAVFNIARLLVGECPRILQDIRAAITGEDAKRLQRGAHTLKGSADVFGARRVVTTALQLEERGRNNELDRAAETFAHLEKEFESLVKVIEAKAN